MCKYLEQCPAGRTVVMVMIDCSEVQPLNSRERKSLG